MNYTQIYIDNIPIDLSTEDISVPLTYALVDIKNLNNRSGAKSKTIKVPRTALNEKIFGLPYDINGQNQFNKYSVHEISIYENSELIFRGSCKLLQATRQEIQLYCYNNISQFKGISGTKTLQDLNLYDLQHVYDETIFDTWTEQYPIYVESDYIYAPIDYGDFFARTLPGTGEVPLFNVVDLYPSVSLRRIIKQICIDNGYTLVTSFFDDPVMDSLYIPFTNEQFVHPDDYLTRENGFEGYTSETILVDEFIGEYPLEILSEVSDALNQFDLVTNEYTSVSTQNVLVQLSGDITIVGTPNTVLVNIRPQQYDSGTLTWSDLASFPYVGDTSSRLQRLEFTVAASLASGDKIRVIVEQLFDDVPVSYTIGFLKITPTNDRVIAQGDIVQLEPNLPAIKQIDLFKWCYQMFNWVVDVDNDNGVIYIETYEDYYRRSESVDFSNRLTLIPEPIISYDDLIFKTKYDFSYNIDDKDYFLTIQNGIDVSQSGQNFGDGRLYLTSEGQAEKIGTVGISPTVIKQTCLGGTDYIELPTMISSDNWNDGAPTKNTRHETRLLFISRYVDVSILTNGSQTSVITENGTYNSIPFGWFQKKKYDDSGLDEVLNMNLSFSINSTSSVDEDSVIYTTGNLIDRFYRNTIQNLSVSAQVDAWFNLNASDVSNIDFSVLWYIEYFNAYFRVNKIVDYLPGKNLPTKVELIKVGVFSGASEDYEPFDT